MKKKWLGLLGMTLVAGMVLTACGANKNEATDETGAAESAKIKFRLCWIGIPMRCIAIYM